MNDVSYTSNKPARYATFDPAKQLTLAQAVSVCRIARDAVRDFDAMRDYPNAANVADFTKRMDQLREIVGAT